MKASKSSRACRVVAVPLLAIITTSVLSAEPTAQRSPDLESTPDFAGTWVGAFQLYPHLMQMSLTLSPAGDGGMHGELAVEPLVAAGRGARTGVVQVTARYQAQARVLEIVPSADASRQIGVRGPLRGMFDPESQVLSGVLMNAPRNASPYFVLARSDAARVLFLDRLRPVASRGPGGSTGSPPDRRRILEWAAQFVDEYPDVDPMRTEHGTLFLMSRNLFRDEYFEPYFGRSFLELGARDRDRIESDIGRIERPRGDSPAERSSGAALAVRRGFAVSGTYSAADIALSIIALRHIEAWRRQNLIRLAELEPTLEALDVIAAIEQAERRILTTLWPSERKELVSALDRELERTAPIAAPVPADGHYVASSTSSLGDVRRFDGNALIVSDVGRRTFYLLVCGGAVVRSARVGDRGAFELDGDYLIGPAEPQQREVHPKSAGLVSVTAEHLAGTSPRPNQFRGVLSITESSDDLVVGTVRGEWPDLVYEVAFRATRHNVQNILRDRVPCP